MHGRIAGARWGRHARDQAPNVPHVLRVHRLHHEAPGYCVCKRRPSRWPGRVVLQKICRRKCNKVRNVKLGPSTNHHRTRPANAAPHTLHNSKGSAAMAPVFIARASMAAGFTAGATMTSDFFEILSTSLWDVGAAAAGAVDLPVFAFDVAARLALVLLAGALAFFDFCGTFCLLAFGSVLETRTTQLRLLQREEDATLTTSTTHSVQCKHRQAWRARAAGHVVTIRCST